MHLRQRHPVLWILLFALLSALTSQASTEKSAGIWLGSAPICNSESNRSCDRLDLLFAQSDQSGDGSTCWTGEKVLCQFRPLSSRLASTEASRLTLVSYNVFARPYVASHDGQRERTCHIPRALLSNVPTADVIVFQEAFVPGCLADNEQLSLRGLLKNYGFEFSTRTVGERRWGFKINGGVFIASRWPIEKQAQIVYRNSYMASADSLANKGAVYARVNKLGTVYHVFGTHLQAEDGPEFDRYRELQAAELNEFVKSISISPADPVLIAGDLNVDMLANRGHLNRLLSNLNASLPRIRGPVRATYDPTQNDVVEAGISASQWLDYVVHSRGHRTPKAASIRAVRLLADKPMRLCMAAPLQLTYVSPESNWCLATARTRNLSDHFPVVAEFLFA